MFHLCTDACQSFKGDVIWRTCGTNYPVNVYIGTQKLTEINFTYKSACIPTNQPLCIYTAPIYIHIYIIYCTLYIMSDFVYMLQITVIVTDAYAMWQ